MRPRLAPDRLRLDADDLAAEIVERTEGDMRVALPLGLGKANTVINAITRRAIDDRSIRLSIMTALTLERPSPKGELERRFIEPALDRLFGRYPPLHYAERMRRGDLPPNIQVNEFFLMAGRWLGVQPMQRHYISANYTHVIEMLCAYRPNVLAQLVALDESGRVSLACNTDITIDLLALRRRGEISLLFVGESNAQLPFLGREAVIGTDELDLMLHDEAGGFELFAVPRQPVQAVDHAIGLHASTLVADGGTLQIGIGTSGDALASALVTRHCDTSAWRALVDACPFPRSALAENDAGRFEQGLYCSTEMLVEGLLQLFLAGIVARRVDGAAIHAGFFIGSHEMYRVLRDMDAPQRDAIAMMPVSFTNALYGDANGTEAQKRAARVAARFFNNAMMVTLLGATVSDTLADGRVVSGVGGQFNFVSQAFELAGARVIMTVPATREKDGRVRSNIVWSHPNATVPRHYRDVVITEYGIANLRGLSDEQAIAALISIADSRFQEGLRRDAVRAGKLDRNFRLATEHRDNTPQAIERWLGPSMADGTLAHFPFGSDFDPVEQRLLAALERLARARSRPRRIAALLWHGLGVDTDSPSMRESLERMGLHDPDGVRQRLWRRLVVSALAVGGRSDKLRY